MSDEIESGVMDFLGVAKDKGSSSDHHTAEPQPKPNNNANGGFKSAISSQAFDLFSKYFNEKGSTNMVSEQWQNNDERQGGNGLASWVKAMGGSTSAAQFSVPRLDLSFNNPKDAVFRQQGGFGSPIAVAAGFEHKKWDSEGLVRQQGLYSGFPMFRPAQPASPSTQSGGAQLTIFYGGTVNVYDNIPADKAQAIMLLASSGIAACKKPVQNSVNAVSSLSEGEGKISAFPATGGAVNPNHPCRKVQADLPIARKHSLQRFLEKRKDRINAKAPYTSHAEEESSSVSEENRMAKEEEKAMAKAMACQITSSATPLPAH